MTHIDYSPKAIEKLFDEMSKTYGFVNLLSSFGFTVFWRLRVAKVLNCRNAVVADFMSGCGEIGAGIVKDVKVLYCVDYSANMMAKAKESLGSHAHVQFHLEDGTATSIASASVDCVSCSFGLKTLDRNGMVRLFKEFHRVLKHGGTASVLEFTVPRHAMLRIPFMVYVRYIVPLIGRVFLGNPDNYRQLWAYTNAFTESGMLPDVADDGTWTMIERSYFFGSAIHYIATKK